MKREQCLVTMHMCSHAGSAALERLWLMYGGACVNLSTALNNRRCSASHKRGPGVRQQILHIKKASSPRQSQLLLSPVYLQASLLFVHYRTRQLLTLSIAIFVPPP